MDSGANREPIIVIQDLVNRFGRQTIHDGLNLEVARGEVIGVVGGSGTGKSVLLRTIVGLNRPASGRIMVLGEEVTRLSDAEWRRMQTRWGVLFQGGALFSSLTMGQNIQVQYMCPPPG